MQRKREIVEKLGRKSRKFDKNRQKETSLFKILCYNGDNHYKGEDGKMLYLKKKFSFFSLRNRLILLFTGAMFCGMTLLGGMLFFYMYNSMKDNISSNIDTTVSAMTDSLDQSFVLIENTVLELAASSGVRSWIEDEDYYNKENPEFYIRREALNKEFQIIPLQGRSLLVVILSSEMTNYYWKELQTELANLNIADAEVYFDFLYRNGLKNRFFKSKLKGMMLISNSLRKCEAPKEYIKVADTFFASHSKWIDSSVLSSFQKIFYKKRIIDTQSLPTAL